MKDTFPKPYDVPDNRASLQNPATLLAAAGVLGGTAGAAALQEVPALKEWAVTCAALSAGQQRVLIRKGGIAEDQFRVPSRRFLLFPTSFHSGAALVRPAAAAHFAEALDAEPKSLPRLQMDTVAEVAGAWTTCDEAVISATRDFHIWTPQYLIKRLRWRRQQPVTILELRCRRLEAPVLLDNTPGLWGCFSWVVLPSSRNVDALWKAAVPTLSDAEDAAQSVALRHVLATLNHLNECSIP